MKYPLVRRRRNREAVLSLVLTKAPGTVVLLYKDRKFILCTTEDCNTSCSCVLHDRQCASYTRSNKLIPVEDIL